LYRNIVLSNPGKRNALSLSMLKSLRQDILHNIDSTDLRVIIISAEGPVFSSGHDLKELTGKEDTKQHMDIFKTCSEVALEILFTGEPMSAQDALRHGLISRVVPEDQLESETLRVAQKICQSSRAVLALGKATFYKQMEHDIGTAYQIASRVMVENLALKDGQEGIEAFISKRKPNWSHS
ncbi:enoyl-CoA hydratase domain-containing protein 3, mitochondrial, partial [Protobothrops mucrosquamatus]|uniref:enoyl-CoA hydratase domain-containing protein 3, mitochondrial n=1 Tax=Protobothrops mucrosquamatus TaxID=103944 RepID=UPI000775ED0F